MTAAVAPGGAAACRSGAPSAALLPADPVPHDVVPADSVPHDVVPHDVVPAGSVPHDPVPADVATLALRARAGDHHALDPLVRATYGDAYGLALRLVGDEHDARDAVQEAYARALRGIRRFRGDAAFTTWLHRITANCAADLLARRSRGRHLHLDALDADGNPTLVDARAEHDPEGRSCDGADRDRLVAALGRLPDRLRRTVVLHDVYDLSHEDVAAELGISVAAARVRLHRARRRLRDDLYSGLPTGAGAGTGVGVGAGVGVAAGAGAGVGAAAGVGAGAGAGAGAAADGRTTRAGVHPAEASRAG